MKHLTAILLCCSLATACQRETAPSAPAAAADGSAANPFFTASTLQYETPPFDKIKDEHYQPALEEGMKQSLAEIEKIANSSEPPTFANTIEPMERSGELLTRVAKVFFNMTQSNTNETLQKVEEEEG